MFAPDEAATSEESRKKKKKKCSDVGIEEEEEEVVWFECSICLDVAVDPVVTLCGHLYCSRCIHKWISVADIAADPPCPVCKSPIFHSTLVPLHLKSSSSKSPPPPPPSSSSEENEAAKFGDETFNDLHLSRRPSVSSSVRTITGGGGGGGGGSYLPPQSLATGGMALAFFPETFHGGRGEIGGEAATAENLGRIFSFCSICALLCLIFF